MEFGQCEQEFEKFLVFSCVEIHCTWSMAENIHCVVRDAARPLTIYCNAGCTHTFAPTFTPYVYTYAHSSSRTFDPQVVQQSLSLDQQDN
jgi:hypothetical protein